MKGQVLKLEENKNNIIMDSQGVLNRNQLNQIELTTHMDNSLTSRLMNTKIVRIHPGSICACVTGYRKMIFNITTISKRDDKERANENETPLFYAEENLTCSCLCFCDCRPFQITFELFDPNTKQLFSTCQIIERDTLVDECFKDSYIILKPIYNYKVNNRNDESMVSRYDTRSIYRTYDYLGKRYYKIGKPYVEGKEPPCCDKCLLCCSKFPFCGCFASCISNEEKPPSKCCDCNCSGSGSDSKRNSSCCSCIYGNPFCFCCWCFYCCCKCENKEGEIDVDKRIYIDIFTMDDIKVGKFAKYFNKGILCQSDELFYEVYFPPDSNEMLRLALISQIIFFHKLKVDYFGVLPGSRDGLEDFIN